MSEARFEAFVRWAGQAPDRMASRRWLGLAAAMALSPLATAAKKGGKANKKCRRQKDPCLAFVAQQCRGSAECLAEANPCCDALATCQLTISFNCLAAALDDAGTMR
jgi:hypothetical protein